MRAGEALHPHESRLSAQELSIDRVERLAAEVSVAVAVHPGEVVSADAVAPENVEQASQPSLRLAVDGSKRRDQHLDGRVDRGVCARS